jgi:hypothetical protein
MWPTTNIDALSGTRVTQDSDRSESQRRMMRIVDDITRGKRKEFDERRAVEAMKKVESLRSLPWAALRPGRPPAERDWVLEQPNNSRPIGFEVTQPPVECVFEINSTIAQRLAAKPSRRPKGSDPAGKALNLAEGDPDLERVQRVQAKCPADRAARFMIEAIERKKRKDAYKEGRFSLHLVLHEPRPDAEPELIRPKKPSR